jgi:hypothetical protein
MRICILCEDKNIEAARENSKNVFPIQKPEINLHGLLAQKKIPDNHLSIPLSKDGTGDPTHWFCFMSCDQTTYDQIVNNSLYSTIEESSPKDFLEKWNLKIIK